MSEPIYKQIERYLKELIASGEIKPGELLPTETHLSEEFNVTRMTVRSAFNNLVKEGYIKRQRGVGSIVLANKINDNMASITSFTRELKSKGYEISTALINLSIVPAGHTVGQALELEPSENVWEIKRVRMANGERVAYMVTYMPVKLFPNLNREHCIHSLYSYIENECGHTISNADRKIEAMIASDEIIELLHLDSEAPILAVEQVANLKGGEKFEYSNSYYYGYTLTVKVVNI
ncbi:MAG: GntR family transcriptional regulator [Cellulosilyticaceae bacterium]